MKLYTYIYIFNVFTQGYNVYQDPEGMRSLEQDGYPAAEMTNKSTVTVDTGDNAYYKKRILSLNEEIKALNNEVAMVSTNCFIMVYAQVF